MTEFTEFGFDGPPTQVVRELIGSIETADLDRVRLLLADDCRYDNVPFGEVRGREAVLGVLGPFLTRYDEVRWVVEHEVHSGTVEAGVVMNERLDRFRRADGWVELPVAGLFIVRHGLVSLWRDYFDRSMFDARFA